MSSWLRRLLRKLRVKRPAQLLASLLFFLLAIGILFHREEFLLPSNSHEGEKGEAQATLAPEDVEVITRTIYEVGPVEEEVKKIPYAELEAIKKEYGRLTPYGQGKDRYIVERKIRDLSPTVKEKGRFGITEDGMLMLYTGDEKERQVIETFFRIDIHRMESGLPREEIDRIRKGIPVHNLAEYNSILSTYGEYALYPDDTKPAEN